MAAAMAEEGVAAPFPLDPFADAALRDPGPFDRAALAAGPVLHLSAYDLHALARHDLVRGALTDWRSFSSASGTGLTHIGREGNWRRPSLILETDPPEHDRYRRLFARLLTGPVLADVRARFAPVADALLAGLVARRRFDAQAELAAVFPAVVIPALLGLPDGHLEVMLAYAELSFNAQGPANARLAASRARAAPILTQVAALCRRDRLAPGGLGARLHDEAATLGLDEEQAATLVRTFFSAAIDTTVNAIGFAVDALARDPAAWAQLRADPGLAGAAFDEALRLGAPSPYLARTTTRDVTVAGVVIPADRKLLLLVGAASRDPRRFAEPDRFVLGRGGTGLAFGFGVHACVGQLVARLEAELVLHALASHAAELRPAGEPVRRFNNWLRGYASLPVEVVAA